jgi:hypothetical protein
MGISLFLPPNAVAETDDAGSAKPDENLLTVAVLGFSASDVGEPELGAQIGEVLTALLCDDAGFRLVDRTAMTRLLAEQQLNLSGIVDTEQAIKVGRLVGARILVVGKVFTLGDQLYLTAKLVGTETSLIDGVIVKGEVGTDIGALAAELADKLAERIRSAGPKLVAQADAGRDPLPDLQAKLASLAKPTVAVVVTEQHLARPSPVPDPAVESELKVMLRACGFTVKDIAGNALTDFVRNASSNAQPWPVELSGVDIIVAGEAFSEFAGRIGSLVSCSARAEINVIERKTGTITHADRVTQRGVDLSENIAAKKALENAGRVLGVGLLNHFAGTLPPAADSR